MQFNFTGFYLYKKILNKIGRKYVASKPHEESLSLFTYTNQESLNFAWQGKSARNWLQALTVFKPVKRSISTYYDGSRPSSCMLWIWCGSSHKTPGCALVCITLVLGCWQGSFVVGCVISTTCSMVPATWEPRR